MHRATHGSFGASLSGLDVDPATGGLLSVSQLRALLAHEHERAVAPRLRRPSPVAGSPPGGHWLSEIPGRVVVVAGANPGAGTSIVALALAEAEAGEQAVQLVECAPSRTSGLAGVTQDELGTDDDGIWREGRRGLLLVTRPVACVPDTAPQPRDVGVTVVDIGAAGVVAPVLGRGDAPQTDLLLVCRASVPGLRQAEQVLSSWGVAQRHSGGVVLAAVGPARWPSVVRASCGRQVQGLLARRRVVQVPVVDRLAVEGPTVKPLPRGVAVAGRRLWSLLNEPAPSTRERSIRSPEVRGNDPDARP